MLAGLVKSPSTYAPTVKMDRAVARRNVVLQVMHETRAIDDAEWKDARSSKIILHDTLRAEEPWGLYFKEQVRQELVARFGWERVYEGGLRVYSTINMATQQAAEAAVAEGLKSIEARRAALAGKKKAAEGPEPPAPLQAALIAMDPATGFVRAMVGGATSTRVISIAPSRPSASRVPPSNPSFYAARSRSATRRHRDSESQRADRDAARRVDA